MTEYPAYTQMSLREMFDRYNVEAAKRSLPLMKLSKRPKDRAAMGLALAMLMARPKPKAAPVADMPIKVRKYNEIRTVAVEELCRIDYYEVIRNGKRLTPADAAKVARNLLVSYGFKYQDVRKRVNERLPNSKITDDKLRVHATNIRNRKPGYEGAKLPDCRFRRNKGTNNG